MAFESIDEIKNKRRAELELQVEKRNITNGTKTQVEGFFGYVGLIALRTALLKHDFQLPPGSRARIYYRKSSDDLRFIIIRDNEIIFDETASIFDIYELSDGSINAKAQLAAVFLATFLAQSIGEDAIQNTKVGQATSEKITAVIDTMTNEIDESVRFVLRKEEHNREPQNNRIFIKMAMPPRRYTSSHIDIRVNYSWHLGTEPREENNKEK